MPIHLKIDSGMGAWVYLSYLLPKGPRTLSMYVRMPHGFEQGERPEEIHAFADSYLKSGSRLVRIGDVKRKGDASTVKHKAATPMTQAGLNYTVDSTQHPSGINALWIEGAYVECVPTGSISIS
jgi:hypothetical protein